MRTQLMVAVSVPRRVTGGRALLAALLAASPAAAAGPIEYQHSYSTFTQSAALCTAKLCRVDGTPVPNGYKLLLTYIAVRYQLVAASPDTAVTLSIDGNTDLLNLPLAAPQPVAGGSSLVSTTLLNAFVTAGHYPTVTIKGPNITASQPVVVAMVGVMTPVT